MKVIYIHTCDSQKRKKKRLVSKCEIPKLSKIAVDVHSQNAQSHQPCISLPSIPFPFCNIFRFSFRQINKINLEID